jgi:succinate dehydrogenase / fumarate reductase, cytochrome b subunit
MRMRIRWRERVTSWVDITGRGMGMIAFALNRVTGLGLVLYLFLHFLLLSLLAVGPSAWNMFVAIAQSPLFLAFDILLFAGLLIHGLNGIRLALIGFGIGVPRQRWMFLAGMTAGALVLLAAAMRLLAGL